MRIAPIGCLFNAHDKEKLADFVYSVSEVTHTSDITIAGAAMIAVAVSSAIENNDFDIVIKDIFEMEPIARRLGAETYSPSLTERIKIGIYLANEYKNNELKLDAVKMVQDNYLEKKELREKLDREEFDRKQKNNKKTFVNKGKPLRKRNKKLSLSLKLGILGAIVSAGIVAVTLDYSSFDKTANRLENSQEENLGNLDAFNKSSTTTKISESSDRNLNLEQKAFNIKLNDIISQYQENADSITSEQVLNLLKESNDLSHDIITTTVFDAYKETNGDAPIKSAGALVTLPPSNYEGAEFRVAYENEDSNYAQVGSHISITPDNIPDVLSRSIEYQLRLESLLRNKDNLDIKDTLKAIMNTTIKTNELSNTPIKYEKGKIVENKENKKEFDDNKNTQVVISDKDDDLEL